MSGTAFRNPQAVRARLGNETYDVLVEQEGDLFEVRVGEESFTVHRQPFGDQGLTSFLINHRPYEVEVRPNFGGFAVNVSGVLHTVEILDPLAAVVKKVVGERPGPEMETVVAPMPGLVISVEVGEGDRVEAGTPLVVVEAMKMQNELAAAHPGVVRHVKVEPGQKVDTKQVLVVLERA